MPSARPSTCPSPTDLSWQPSTDPFPHERDRSSSPVRRTGRPCRAHQGEERVPFRPSQVRAEEGPFLKIREELQVSPEGTDQTLPRHVLDAAGEHQHRRRSQVLFQRPSLSFRPRDPEDRARPHRHRPARLRRFREMRQVRRQIHLPHPRGHRRRAARSGLRINCRPSQERGRIQIEDAQGHDDARLHHLRPHPSVHRGTAAHHPGNREDHQGRRPGTRRPLRDSLQDESRHEKDLGPRHRRDHRRES
jgi:hypothetical protein